MNLLLGLTLLLILDRYRIIPHLLVIIELFFRGHQEFKLILHLIDLHLPVRKHRLILGVFAVGARLHQLKLNHPRTFPAIFRVFHQLFR